MWTFIADNYFSSKYYNYYYYYQQEELCGGEVCSDHLKRAVDQDQQLLDTAVEQNEASTENCVKGEKTAKWRIFGFWIVDILFLKLAALMKTRHFFLSVHAFFNENEARFSLCMLS
jgi:hypothetical protein